MSPNGTPFANTATPNIAGFYMGMVKCERKIGNIVKGCQQLYNCLRKDCINISIFLASGLCLDFMNVGALDRAWAELECGSAQPSLLPQPNQQPKTT